MSNEKGLVPMSGPDGFWLNMDMPTNLMIICGYMEFDRPVEYDKIVAKLEERLLIFNRFRQRLVWPAGQLGPTYWEFDPHFDIRTHVIRIALPSPGDDAELKKMVSDLTIVPLDYNKPMWQIYLIENYGKGNVLFFRLHHCIGDGIALIRLLFSLTDLEPNVAASKRVDIKQGVGDTTIPDFLRPITPIFQAMSASFNTGAKIGAKLLEEVMRSFAHPAHIANMARALGDVARESAVVLAKLLIMPTDSDTSLKGPLGVTKSVSWSEPVKLDEVKAVGKSLDATINDVLMAAVAGALRKYLQGRNEDVKDTEIRMSIPFNVRTPSPEIELGNKFSIVFLKLPVYIEDPIKRVLEVKKRMDSLKRSPDAFVGYQVLRSLGIPPSFITKLGASLFTSKVTGVLTNVPGPRFPLYFTDRKIKNLMFWVPRISSVGHGFSVMSYDGKVSFGVATDTGLVPDPDELTKHFTEEFKEMQKLIKSGKKK